MQTKTRYYAAISRTSDCGKKETNDCSVRALAIAADITYRKAHAILEHFGREHRKGVNTKTLDDAAEFCGMQKTTYPHCTVGQFIAANPKGAFLVVKPRHAFAIVDGVVYDWGSTSYSRSRVIRFYKMGE